jgi:cation transport ATPase
MLIGKYFQKRTYSALSYDRDYKSFYPIAVTKVDFGGNQENILLSEIKVGDRILVRNQEIIPVDAILINGEILTTVSSREKALQFLKNREIKFLLVENKLVLS